MLSSLLPQPEIKPRHYRRETLFFDPACARTITSAFVPHCTNTNIGLPSLKQQKDAFKLSQQADEWDALTLIRILGIPPEREAVLHARKELVVVRLAFLLEYVEGAPAGVGAKGVVCFGAGEEQWFCSARDGVSVRVLSHEHTRSLEKAG